MSYLATIRQWTAMSEAYTRFSTYQTGKIFSAMVPFLDLENAQIVCEAGCGPGHCIPILLEHLPPQSRIEAWDLTPKFVEDVKQKQYPRTNVQIGNNLEIAFSDATFDRYTSNLTLQLVPDAQLMANEAFRVLRPGGIAAFSVWGKESDCTFFKTLKEASEGVAEAPVIHNFHLNSRNRLKEIMQKAGFNSVLIYEENAFIPGSPEEVVDGLLEEPEYKEMQQNQPEKYSVIRSRCIERVNRYIEDSWPVCFAAFIVIAYKP